MLKFILSALMLVSIQSVAHAQNCASNLDQLRTLVAHADVPLRWLETSERKPDRVLSMALSNHGSGIKIELKLPDGTLWANLIGQICSNGGSRTSLTMPVNRRASGFGPGAPWAVRNLGGVPREVTLGLSGDYSSLQVRASSYRGTYRAR